MNITGWLLTYAGILIVQAACYGMGRLVLRRRP